MDVSRKLYKENIILLNEFQAELLKKDKKFSQKALIDKSIKFVMEHKKNFFDYLLKGHVKDNTKEMTAKFLALPKIKVNTNWMKEIDTIEHEDMLKRNK